MVNDEPQSGGLLFYPWYKSPLFWFSTLSLIIIILGIGSLILHKLNESNDKVCLQNFTGSACTNAIVGLNSVPQNYIQKVGLYYNLDNPNKTYVRDGEGFKVWKP